MIKTVSFAPPRAASSRSAAKAPASPRKASSRAASGSPSSQTSLDFSAPETPPAPVKPASKVKDKPAKAEAPKATAASKAVEIPKAKATKTTPVPPSSPQPTAIKSGTEKLKGKRVYAPKDLAAQYGEKVVERPTAAPVLETVAPKKRLNKAEREARRQLIKPDEGLRERLARASQVTVKKVKSEPRGKGWKFECGRCGTVSYFQTPGAVCVCGTIAIKE